MAKTFAAAMAENNFIAKKQDWNWPLDKTDEQYKDFAAVTELDLEIGALKIERLTSRWPYQSPVMMSAGIAGGPAAVIRQLTAAYLQQKIFWNDAHYRLAEYYASQQQYDRAEKEYRAVLKIIPENYHPYFKIGELYLLQEKFVEAEAWLSQALQRHRRSPFVFAKLATAHFFAQAYGKAVANFDTALALNKGTGEFSAAESGWAEYYKAVSHLQLGQKQQGMEALAEAARLLPANAQAKQLLALLQSNAEVRLQFTK
jgi:tetratricopeptide (TPR) repeat protein